MPDGIIQDPDPPTGTQRPCTGPISGALMCDECHEQHIYINNLGRNFNRGDLVSFEHCSFNPEYSPLKVAINVNQRGKSAQ